MWALRSVALMRLAACDFDLSDQLDLASHPTRLGFGVESGRYLRGSVIGNAALILGICLGALLLTLARMRIGPRGRQQLSLRRAASLLSLPGWLLVPFGLVMQPTLSSAVSLLKYSPGGAGDVALGIAGLVFCIAPLFYCADVLLRRFRATSILAIDVGIPMTREPLWRAWRWLMWRKYAWVEAAAGAHFVERYEVLFDGYRPRRHWFGLVEMSVTVVCGVLTGLLPIDPGSNCVDLLAAMCAANTALLLTFFALRPLETRVEVGAALLNYACGALWGPLVLTNRIGDAQRCATAQVWLQVVLLGLLVVRIVLNGVLLRAVRRFGSATAAFVRGTEFDMGRFDLDVSFKRCKTFRQNDYFSKVAEEKLEVAAAIDDGKDGESGAATKINGTQRSHQVLKKQVADETSSKPVGAQPQQQVVGTTDGAESYQERHLQISNHLKDLLPPKTRSAQLKTLRLLISVIALDRKRARFNTAKKLLLKQ
ncbi:membrane-associated protein, putative [Bodo saltans]|uniref:Membrane-associated protein, putative n=1 Tax=Bodo saltans TaxID=75058 RepID=A0A0S4JRT8_BODSA|nr:membrane-associated protein, putative [Bodo saltans]|eukprot:CUG92901.1 membrane-associated protein, putative [Bodo saltans]